jgi:hypothetical protein
MTALGIGLWALDNHQLVNEDYVKAEYSFPEAF